ncbi:urea ABC transporter permease subunit UrtB [Magnetospira sp. QH-2]|uniref:urea ABC transporter permease subunit UrtB n=1 Tax=Magnetospira sp. (strain QH-2) TaxID=1288970 RepID=UPI0003E81402|nr:urea ABC transporter permease subunit UrtB [Magnetospira sp. QH-2]CCQ72714.1 Putative ABC transporter, urea, permease protein, UrtB [Magnetospira sp. QH-2]
MFNLMRIVTAALMLMIALSGPSAQAATLEEGIAALGAKSYKAKIAAVQALGTAGDDRAAPVLQAMTAGKLYLRKSDKKIVITEKQGDVYVLTDPISGEEVGQTKKRELKKIGVNNKLRGIIRGVMGALTLFSKDPAKRLESADALFSSKSADSLPLLKKALAREEDEAVKGRMERAQAAVTLSASEDQAAREQALVVLADYPDPDVQSLLTRIVAQQDDPVAPAAAKALEKIQDSLAFWHAIGAIFQGVSLGSVLLLAAVGLAITFGVMGVINMAHGELVMLGAYTTFMVQEAFRAYMPGAFDYSLFVAVPAAFLVAGAFGVAIERSVIRFLYGRPLETLLATWGISLILQQLVRTFFGPTNRDVGTPDWMSGALETASGLVLTYNRITIIVFSLMVLLAIAIVLRKTAFGLQMRAVTQNRRMASSMGIRTGWVDAMTFGLGAGIAGVAGVALSQIDNVSPNLGQAYIIDSFMVVVFGGVGNLWGTLVGAFSLGIANKFLEPYAGAVLAKIFVLVAIILFIQKRPRGLFALKGRAVEA